MNSDMNAIDNLAYWFMRHSLKIIGVWLIGVIINTFTLQPVWFTWAVAMLLPVPGVVIILSALRQNRRENTEMRNDENSNEKAT